jgi:S-adenosylmethionine hydrolase
MQIKLSEILAEIKVGKTKAEIRSVFALSAAQGRDLFKNQVVIDLFEQVKNEKIAQKEAEKAAKKAAKSVQIVDDLTPVAESIEDLEFNPELEVDSEISVTTDYDFPEID